MRRFFNQKILFRDVTGKKKKKLLIMNFRSTHSGIKVTAMIKLVDESLIYNLIRKVYICTYMFQIAFILFK